MAVVVTESEKISRFELFEDFQSAPVTVILHEGHQNQYNLKSLQQSAIVQSCVDIVAIECEKMSSYDFFRIFHQPF